MNTWVVIGILAAASAWAQTKVYVNGQAIEASLIETNGTLYVPVSAIARALGMDVTIKKDAVHIDSPVVEPAPPKPPGTAATPTVRPWSEPAPPPSFTAIRGRLTWTQSIMINPPDRHAQVWLVPEGEVAALAAAAAGNSDEPIPTRATGWPARLDREHKFIKSVADADGKFGFDNVAPGAYTLILASQHANGLAARDRQGKMRFKKIVVHAGQILDASFNFGVTAYKN